ncbi:hypothetical protein [Paraburkholderia sp. BR10882]|uniref:hypothetical protein n=1 Tax=unclassified Paraburkholderia TaxID=2615204 RepID=UPI0034CE4F7E
MNDERACTIWIRIEDSVRVDALATLYRRDRREVLRDLITFALRTLTDKSVMPGMLPADSPDADIPPVPRITTLRRVP